MTAKEIYNIIREKPYKDGEQMIKDYAKQKVEERDEQWDNALAMSGKLFTQEDLIIISELLSEPEYD